MNKNIFIIIFTIIVCSKAFAYTEEFTAMIDIMGVERQTEHGYVLNEELYNQYNQFVYGSPLMITSGQRWKTVKNGLWTKNAGAWKGTGIRGEYWILGYNESEKEIHNHKFPVDIEPPTPPTSWRYVELSDALASWNDITKYLDDDQKNYMLNTKLMRNDTTYDLTATDIGITKARVENYATWKTNGNIYTRRYDMNNKEWAANFIVPPMAADAALSSYLNLPNGNSYTIPIDGTIVEVPVNFGAEAINLTDYAKKEHVKIIKSELYIDNLKVAEIADEKEIAVAGNSNIIINKNNYSENLIEIEVKVKSTLLTEFLTDGALVDIKTEKITLHIDGEEEIITENVVDSLYERDSEEFPPPRITDIKITRIDNNRTVELPVAKKTNGKFICAGQVLQIDIKAENWPSAITLEFEGDTSINTLDALTKKFEWDDPKERNVSRRYITLSDLEEQYDGVVRAKTIKKYENGDKDFRITYVVPYGTKQTLHSWSTLRNESKDAFSIDESRLFSRIKKPYELVFKVRGAFGATTASVSLDVYERWDTLYNRDLTPYIKK